MRVTDITYERMTDTRNNITACRVEGTVNGKQFAAIVPISMMGDEAACRDYLDRLAQDTAEL